MFLKIVDLDCDKIYIVLCLGRVMESKFLKVYLYLIIYVGLINFIACNLKAVSSSPIVTILAVLATLVEFPAMLILSIIAIFYIRSNKHDKSLLILPIFYLIFYVSFLVVGFIALLRGNNLKDLSIPANLIYFILTDLFYLAQIVYAIYLLKKKRKLLETKQKRKPKITNKTLGVVSIVLGGISFIPLIGFFTGIAAVVTGIVDIRKNKSKLGVIGLVLGIIGIIITVGMYAAIFYFGFVKRGGMYDNLKTDMAKTQLGGTINDLEAYKVRFGEYPQNLTELNLIANEPTYADPLQVNLNNNKDIYFYYENHGDFYYLFSRGIDGIPFTADDVFPDPKYLNGVTGYKSPN